MPNYYMAIDVGASSGRNILGWLENGKIRLREIHRFANGPENRGGTLVWNVDRLFEEMTAGLRLAGEMGLKPKSVGVDTWGVDFVLLDTDDSLLGNAVAYRDARTRGMIEKVAEIISPQELYARTGIQSLVFNTIFQLQAMKTRSPGLIEQASRLLMMPDYLHFLLTGLKTNEYTEASTSQLLSAGAKDWDRDLINTLGYPSRIFGPISQSGIGVGTLRPEVRERVGYDLEVVLPPTHDTASAVLAVPDGGRKSIYLSSGTWSLIGIENTQPDCRDEARRCGFTNEGGYGGRYRFLKNIMGLWIIQSLRKEIAPEKTFAEVASLAREGLNYEATIDITNEDFLAPDSMKGVIVEHVRRSGAPEPDNDAQLLACAYKSLAKSYAVAAEEIEAISGEKYNRINIVGGGCQDALLNELTARATGREVFAGPVEGTAIGNILSQMLRDGIFVDVAEARRAVADSFEVKQVAADGGDV